MQLRRHLSFGRTAADTHDEVLRTQSVQPPPPPVTGTMWN
jgi:hypothetical protein